MKIFVTGQSTLHWGRLEFGNIGNYYIIEPFFRELHNVFPQSKIKTTFQFSDEFCKRVNVDVLPMEIYYDFRSVHNLEKAQKELEYVESHPDRKIGNADIHKSGYIKAVEWSDIVIDLSGDIWGDNADFLGKDRFEVGLLKDFVAQKMGKPTYLLAGSPGSFNNPKTRGLAKQVFEGFTLVTNREPISTQLLEEWGFEISNVKSLACPSFLFEPAERQVAYEALEKEGLRKDNKSTIGFILCGWNFEEGPFDKWPREDKEYENFVSTIEEICEKYDVNICLMSHSNGFPVPPQAFKLLHGRDYPIVKQLERILKERNPNIPVYTLNDVYDARTTKAIIGQFDMLISGRIHGATAGFSQCIPTVVIDYGHEPKAHKLLGFATVVGQEKMVADPKSAEDLINITNYCWENRIKIKQELATIIPMVKMRAKENFELVRRSYEKVNRN